MRLPAAAYPAFAKATRVLLAFIPVASYGIFGEGE